MYCSWFFASLLCRLQISTLVHPLVFDSVSAAMSMNDFSLLEAELSACSEWMPNIGSLQFVNDPVHGGPYQSQDFRQIRCPNVGLYALTSAQMNQIYLEHESRLCDILNMLEAINATDRKESLEDCVLQELIRINRLKGIEWSGHAVKEVSGTIAPWSTQVILILLLDVTVSDDALESYFVTRHPRNPTLLAIYMTTLVMYVLYRLPCRGAAVLLAGMRSILNSQESLRSLVGELPKDL